MALGLSIIYGQMGVINMAHGELMMLGAYATYEMQRLFVHHFPIGSFNWYYVAALPFAFCVAAFIGWLIELIVVRHLYGRVLETLLGDVGRQPDPGSGRPRALRRQHRRQRADLAASAASRSFPT